MYMFPNYAVLVNNFWNLSMKHGTVELVNKGASQFVLLSARSSEVQNVLITWKLNIWNLEACPL